MRRENKTDEDNGDRERFLKCFFYFLLLLWCFFFTFEGRVDKICLKGTPECLGYYLWMISGTI